MPSDVRKRSALPLRLFLDSGFAPKLGAAPDSLLKLVGRSKDLPHIGRRSRTRSSYLKAQPLIRFTVSFAPTTSIFKLTS